MSIRSRGDRWLVTVESGRDVLGVRRRHCATCDTYDEAKRTETRIRAKVYAGNYVKPSTEPVAVFCQRFLDGRERLKPATRSRYQHYVDHIARDLRGVTLARFTPVVGEAWKAAQLESGLSPATVRKHLVFARAAMRQAVRQHLVAENPLHYIELPPDSLPRFHVYTLAEQAAILSATAARPGAQDGHHIGRSDGSLYLPVALALGTGMRQGELLGLRLSDVDLAKGRLHVRQSMSKDAEGRSVIGPPKTDRSRRTIALPASLVDLLAGYLARRPAIRSELLLVNSRARPFTLEGFKSSWRKARQRAVDIMVADAEALGDPHADSAGDGLRSSRFHDLRHTHASEMLRAGINPKVIAERLGDSEMTVLRTYAHVLPDMQEGAAEAADALLAGLLT